MTAFVLRMIALSSMLIDHIALRIFPNRLWMTCIGRLAFPIFAFQLTEGYQKTRDKRRYAFRLFLFAVLSEIPFDLMTYDRPFFWGHQNVLWTLLFGFLVIWLADLVIRRWCDPSVCFCAVFYIVLTVSAIASLLQLDYGGPGILLIFSFHMLRNRPFILPFLAAFCISILMDGPNLALGGIQIPIQVLGTLSVVLIRFYSGQSGHRSKVWSWFCYLFYPLHLLVLSFL